MESGSQSSDLISTSASVPLESFVVEEMNNNEASNVGEVSFWCYFCSKLVSVEPDRAGDNLEMVCPDCCGGFIQAMSLSQPSSTASRSRRRNRRHHRGMGSSIQSLESLDSAYARHITQSLQLHSQGSEENSMMNQGHQSDQEYDGGMMVTVDDLRSQPSLTGTYHPRRAFSEIGSEGYDYNDSIIGDSDTNITFSAGYGGFSDASVDLLGDGQTAFDTDTFLPQQDNESHVGGDSESGIDTTRMDFYDWDSVEDDDDDDGEWEVGVGGDDDGEWEVGVGGDDDGSRSEGMGESIGALGTEETSEMAGQPRWFRSGRTRWRYLRYFREHYRDRHADFLDYLSSPRIVPSTRAIRSLDQFRNAVRGVEDLLQHLAESDNAVRGAPAAAESVIEKLPLVVIDELLQNEDKSDCAVCKESLTYGDEANQLPCMHLYHPNCILPWLRARNTCPVCRYELPTDDMEYEEQKRQRGRIANLVYQNQNSDDGGQREYNEDTAISGSSETHRTSQGGTSSEGINTVEQEVASEFALETQVQSEGREIIVAEANVGKSGSSENVTSEISGRSWITIAAVPVLSMIGFVMCLYFRGMQTRGQPEQMMPRQISRRRWWNFFRG